QDQEEVAHNPRFFSRKAGRRKTLSSAKTMAAGLLVLIVLLGFYAVMAVAQGSFDLRQWAWEGAQFNQEFFEQNPGSSTDLSSIQGDSAVVELFSALTFDYPQADTVTVELPEYEVSGVLFKHFEPSIQGSFVYGRVQNVPVLPLVPK